MLQSSLKFRQLPAAAQNAVARRMMQVAQFAGGHYDAVDGQTSRQRAPSIIELGGEDDILTSYKRGRMTNLMRQQLRNAPISRTIDQQRRVNVVGLVGGKLTISAPGAENACREWQNWFNSEWAPQAEFTDELHFNELLKLALSTADNTGDLVLLFDDGTLGNTGRIRGFESDEVANLSPDAFRTRFGAQNFRQSQGRIYDALGRSVGCCVSTSQRGMTEFDPAKCFILTRDMAQDKRDCYWAFVKRNFRLNQGRGVSPTSSSVSTLTDIQEIVGSETQCTKINSKLFGQLIDSADSPAESAIPSEFRPTESDQSGDTAPEGADADATPAELADASPPALTFEQFDAIGAMYDIMPPKLKMELLDTKRPNTKIIEFIDFLSGQATGVFGLSRLFANLTPEASYTAFRGAQCLSWPSMAEAQKDLERSVCDWAVRNAIRWAIQNNSRNAPRSILPPNWANYCAWQWPEMPEVNIVDAQTALTKQLANLDTTYRARLGPQWREQLNQAFEEIEFFRSRGVIHPAEQTVSGAVIPQPATSNKGSDNETQPPQV